MHPKKHITLSSDVEKKLRISPMVQGQGVGRRERISFAVQGVE